MHDWRMRRTVSSKWCPDWHPMKNWIQEQNSGLATWQMWSFREQHYLANQFHWTWNIRKVNALCGYVLRIACGQNWVSLKAISLRDMKLGWNNVPTLGTAEKQKKSDRDDCFSAQKVSTVNTNYKRLLSMWKLWRSQKKNKMDKSWSLDTLVRRTWKNTWVFNLFKHR